MMKYSQYSRIAHHAISTGAFSIAESEDFTDGTWVASDLVDREVGIQLSDKKAYLRIGDTIKEIMLDDVTDDDLTIPVTDVNVTVIKYEDFTTLLMDFSIIGEIDGSNYCATYRCGYSCNSGTAEQIGDPQLTAWTLGEVTPFIIVVDTGTVSIVLDASIAPNTTWVVRLNTIKK